MARTVFDRVSRIKVTLVYGVLLLFVDTTLLLLGPDWQDTVIRHASTNLHNLGHGHLGTLLVSAFVVDASPVLIWLPGFLCLLGVAELLWGSWRLVVALVAGHVGATLLVAGALGAGVTLGWLPADVTRASDVGMSYAAAAVLGALTPAVPRGVRPAWFCWWLAAGSAAVWAGRDFTDAGHVVALTLGMVVGTRFGPAREWTPIRTALFGIGAAFGFLVIANTTTELVVAMPCGAVGALVGYVVGNRHRRDRPGPRVARVTADP